MCFNHVQVIDRIPSSTLKVFKYLNNYDNPQDFLLECKKPDRHKCPYEKYNRTPLKQFKIVYRWCFDITEIKIKF